MSLLALLSLLLLATTATSDSFYYPVIASAPASIGCGSPASLLLCDPTPFTGYSSSCCTDPSNSNTQYCSGSGWVCCGCVNSTSCGSCHPSDHCIGTATCATEAGYIVIIVVPIVAGLLLCACLIGCLYCCCCGCPELCACLLCAWCCCELEGMV